jgi:hypothetical protein
MYTTSDEKGILNNYAKEPKLYYAEFPTKAQQSTYAFQGVVAILPWGLAKISRFGICI